VNVPDAAALFQPKLVNMTFMKAAGSRCLCRRGYRRV